MGRTPEPAARRFRGFLSVSRHPLTDRQHTSPRTFAEPERLRTAAPLPAAVAAFPTGRASRHGASLTPFMPGDRLIYAKKSMRGGLSQRGPGNTGPRAASAA
jgi:hypothetical protein